MKQKKEKHFPYSLQELHVENISYTAWHGRSVVMIWHLVTHMDKKFSALANSMDVKDSQHGTPCSFGT